MKVYSAVSWMVIALLMLFLLVYGEPIIVPFVIALLIWFIVKKMRNILDKSLFIQKYIPSWLKTGLASFVIFGGIFFIGQMLTANIQSLVDSYNEYISNIEQIAIKINEVFNINLTKELNNFVGNFNFSSYLQSLFNSLSEILGNMVMIIFYVVFLFVEESLFQNKFKLIFESNNRYDKVSGILSKIDKSMSSYISLKSLVSFLTTTLSYFIMLAIGIDSPLFWAFLIFIFNFIPSIGPILGTLLPAMFCLIQFGTFAPALIVLFGVGGVSVLVGSLVEPKLMGNTLNISPLVAIFSLALWGSIWGIIGMLLSVPITVAMIIVFSQFPSTRSIAILLSEKGKV
ncbi:MAG: AI-2E family transporter [Crocinitomicaceae bacterium]